MIYSLGHGSLSEASFLHQLARFGIRCLADVRRYPGSRRHPQFAKSALERSCSRASIDYVHLGEELGGFRDVSYEEHVSTESFRKGLAELEARALRSPTAFLCAEKLPWKCHRRFIARELEARGWDVRHIADGQLLLI